MAIQQAVVVAFQLTGDGTTTVFTTDLKDNPVALALPSNSQNVSQIDWTNATGAAFVNPAFGTASISGHSLTLTFNTAPNAAGLNAQVQILF